MKTLNIYISFWFLFIGILCRAQENLKPPKLCFFTSIEQAEKYPADTIKCLDLRSKGYKKFPMEIFKFLNLEYLYLDAFDARRDSCCLHERQYKKILKQEEYEDKNPTIGKKTLFTLGPCRRNKIKMS